MLSTLLRLAPYVRRYRGRYLLGAGLVVTAVVLRMVVPTLLGTALDQLHESEESGADLGTDLLWIAIAMVGAAALGAAVRTGSRLLILGNSRRAVHDLRRNLFAHLLRLAPSFYVRHQTGHIMSRCVNDVQFVQGLMGPVFMYLVETAILYAVGLWFMMATDPLLTLVGVLPFPLFLFVARRLATGIQRDSRAAQEQLADLSAKLDESLSGVRVIRGLALEARDADQFTQRARTYRQTMLRLARTRALLQPSMVALAALSTVLVLAVGAPRITAGTTSVGDLVSFIFYLGILAGPTGVLGFVLSSLQRGTAALRRVTELLDMEVSITEPQSPDRGKLTDGRIEVRDLTIRYAPLSEQAHLSGSLPSADDDALLRGRTVLDSVSFTLAPGQTLGVVGPTGAGKTTLLRALCRQVEVPAGTVFLDGRDVTTLPLQDLRASIGVVPQDSFLFSRSLADNVAFGDPGATREAVGAAVDAARLTTDLDQLQEGLETMVGERGVQLSGGQRQRTALARVHLLDPVIIMLDDALSAIDTATADAILTELQSAIADRTTVLVAHRVATVQRADHILVLDEGRIVEQGTHDQLLAADGHYAALWQRQEEGR